ncbi:MAG: sugar ABC transporter substrate-binding protein [Candidatus Caldatribacteriaceae bacterium]
MKRFFILVVMLVVGLALVGSVGATPKKVAVLTPYLASVTTHEMIQAFVSFAKEKGWDVTVIDTKGDFGALANRWEDVIAQKVDAIVMGMGDPNQFTKQIEMANQAGIPVFGGDAGYIEGMVCNVTSNNYVLSAQITSYLLDKLKGKGKIAKLYHSAHPGVQKREVIFDAIVKNTPEIEVVAEHWVQVPGPIEDARQAVQSILLAHPDINAIWAAWDEPAIGAALAIKEAGKENQVIVTGIDGNKQALEMIRDGSPIIATVKQDFVAIARILAEQVEKVFAGEQVSERIFYAASPLVTRENVEQFLNQ